MLQRRSLSWNRPRARRRGCANWFGTPLATQQSKCDAGRIVPALLAEIRGALLARGGLAQCDALFSEPSDGTQVVRLRESLESGEAPAAVVSSATSAVLVALLHQWMDSLPGGLWATANGELALHLCDDTRQRPLKGLLEASPASILTTALFVRWIRAVALAFPLPAVPSSP
jgi:hypothetical protein